MYRRINVHKNGDIVYICSIKMNYDVDNIKTKNQHVCGYDPTVRNAEAKQQRIRSRKNSGDVSKRPSAVVRNELQTLEESHLQPNDIRNAALALYRERREKQPTSEEQRRHT